MTRLGIASKKVLLGLVAVAVMLAIAGAISFMGYARRAAPDAHRFAVAPFEIYVNGLEHWRLDIANSLTDRLHNLAGWSAVPQTLIAQRWQGKDRPEIAAVEVARRTAAGIAIYGRVDSVGGDSVRVHVLMIDVPTTIVSNTVEVLTDRSSSQAVTDSIAAQIAAIVNRRS